jgi:hypothetical protein
MPETTENYHRIPVSSGHDDHDITTITISDSEGIKALYCTDCKEVVTYLFDVDKWTMEEAQEWVDDHKDDSIDASFEVREMDKGLDRRTKDNIGSMVRYKSHGQFVTKSADVAEDDGKLFVRGFYTDDGMDEVGDIITREATEKAIKKWRKWGNIRTMHDYPSGVVDKIGEGDGLAWNEIVTVPVDKQTRELIEGGVLKAYSVGIIPRKYEVNEDAISEDDEWWFLPLIIHEYDMVEISYVDHPANYSATISDISEGKSKEFAHRAVLFKNMDIIGDVEDMDVEFEDTEVAEESAEEEVQEMDAADLGDEVTEPEAEITNSEDSEDEVVEKEEESEFDIEYAVRGIGDRLSVLEEQLENIAEYMADGLAEVLIDRFMDALSEHKASEVVDVSDVESDAEPEPVEVEASVDVDEIVEKVIEGLAKALSPEAVRSASVSVDGDEQEQESENQVDRTKYYKALTPDDRRQKMKEILSNITNK